MGFLSSNVFFADYGGRGNNTRPFRFCSFGDLLREANIYERYCLFDSFAFIFFFFFVTNKMYIVLKFDIIISIILFLFCTIGRINFLNNNNFV